MTRNDGDNAAGGKHPRLSPLADDKKRIIATALVVLAALVGLLLVAIVSIAGSYFFTTSSVNASRHETSVAVHAAELKAATTSCQGLRHLAEALGPNTIGTGPEAQVVINSLAHLYDTREVNVGTIIYQCPELAGNLYQLPG